MSTRHPVVFVHGLFGRFDAPDAVRELGEGVRTAAPDLDGYGALAARSVSLGGQVEAVLDAARGFGGEPVHVVAHSIGAVYAFLAADAAPEAFASVVSVEGNFSLADAFWSRAIAGMDAGAAEESVSERLGDPLGFLEGDGIVATPELLDAARRELDYQPWRAVWESARAIVAETGSPGYERVLRRVFGSMPVHLVAGERSVGGWGVPDWARVEAAGVTVVPGVGHMMMLEEPGRFGRALAGILKD